MLRKKSRNILIKININVTTFIKKIIYKTG